MGYAAPGQKRRESPDNLPRGAFEKEDSNTETTRVTVEDDGGGEGNGRCKAKNGTLTITCDDENNVVRMTSMAKSGYVEKPTPFACVSLASRMTTDLIWT
jgi:hypothetical protein